MRELDVVKAKKNDRRIKSIFFGFMAFLFFAAIFLPGHAGASGTHLVDSAGVLSSSESDKLMSKLDKISSSHNVDVVIVAVDSLDGKTAQAYADDYYDYNGYSNDGILYLMSKGDRKWAISTKGTCIRAFTDAGQAYITDNITEYLSDGDYYSAFDKFADYTDDYLTQYEKGKPYDSGNLPKEPFKGLKNGLISILAGLGVGFGHASILKADTKTVKKARNATGYLTGSNITGANEIFLYSEFHKIERSEGSGSSTHISSSGSTHGGSSGSF